MVGFSQGHRWREDVVEGAPQDAPGPRTRPRLPSVEQRGRQGLGSSSQGSPGPRPAQFPSGDSSRPKPGRVGGPPGSLGENCGLRRWADTSPAPAVATGKTRTGVTRSLRKTGEVGGWRNPGPRGLWSQEALWEETALEGLRVGAQRSREGSREWMQIGCRESKASVCVCVCICICMCYVCCVLYVACVCTVYISVLCLYCLCVVYVCILCMCWSCDACMLCVVCMCVESCP